MQTITSIRSASAVWAGILSLSLVVTVHAQDFTVTTPGSFFRINGTGSNPTITLVRGSTYTFSLATSGFHPFFIGTSVGGGAPAGVSGNNGSSSGTITFNVPTNAPNCVYYCTVHFFSGSIVMTNPPAPPPPPTVQIVGLTVGTNLVLTSTGTNTWTSFPEFSTNLANGNWFALTVQSNRFFNGTNETICGRPPGDAVYLRIRAQQNP
jgi:hypothetical protein